MEYTDNTVTQILEFRDQLVRTCNQKRWLCLCTSKLAESKRNMKDMQIDTSNCITICMISTTASWSSIITD